MVTQDKTYTLTHHQLNGLDKLFFWCTDKYQQSTSRKEKRMWSGRRGFITRIQTRGIYTEDEKRYLNQFREMYLKDFNQFRETYLNNKV